MGAYLLANCKNIKICIKFLEYIVVKGMTESFWILSISSKSAFISSFEKWLERQPRQPTAPLTKKQRARSLRDLRSPKVCLRLFFVQQSSSFLDVVPLEKKISRSLGISIGSAKEAIANKNEKRVLRGEWPADELFFKVNRGFLIP